MFYVFSLVVMVVCVSMIRTDYLLRDASRKIDCIRSSLREGNSILEDLDSRLRAEA